MLGRYTYSNPLTHDVVLVERSMLDSADVREVWTSPDSSFLVAAYTRNPKSKTKKIDPKFGLLPAVERLRWRPKHGSKFVYASLPKAAYTFLMRHGFQSGDDPNEGST